MLKLHHDNSLRYYVNKYNLNSIFNSSSIKNLELHCFNKNEFIALKSTFPNYLYFLVEGSAIKYIDSSSVPEDTYKNFTIIGSMEIFNEINLDYNIKATSDCICIGFPIYLILDNNFNDLVFLKYFCRFFSNKLSTDNFNFLTKEKDAI